MNFFDNFLILENAPSTTPKSLPPVSKRTLGVVDDDGGSGDAKKKLKVEEDPKSPAPVLKRRRIMQIVDSDSDSDSENKVVNGPAIKRTETETKTETATKTETEVKPKPSSCMDKLAKFKSVDDRDASEKEKLRNMSEAIKKEPELIDDEPTVWLHLTLDFLKPEKIKDASGRRPSDANYDPRTLFVPESFLKDQSPAMRQWWVLKAQYFDCILFFKVGKFYEFYHMDAVISVQELQFTYMKGNFAHTGMPESSYHKMASTLIDKGHKVMYICYGTNAL